MKDIGIQQQVPILTGKEMEPGAAKTDQETSFPDFLKNAIHNVDTMQKEASKAAEDLAVGRTENIHETMIALEKADLSFKMMMQVRNKLVRAYEEVMRMQV